MAAPRVLPAVRRKTIKWPLRSRGGKGPPWEARFHSETDQEVRSVFGAPCKKKKKVQYFPESGTRKAACGSSLHCWLSIVTLPRVLPGVLKAYFSLRQLFSRTVWPEAPHNPPRCSTHAVHSPAKALDGSSICVCVRVCVAILSTQILILRCVWRSEFSKVNWTFSSELKKQNLTLDSY